MTDDRLDPTSLLQEPWIFNEERHGNFQRFKALLCEAAETEQWNFQTRFELFLSGALSSVRGDNEAAGVELVDEALKAASDISSDAVRTTLRIKGGLEIGAAVNCLASDCYAEATKHYASAFKSFVEIGCHAGAIDCLRRLCDLARLPVSEVAGIIAEEVGSIALETQAKFGGEATILLQGIWGRLIAALPLLPSVALDRYLIYLQLAKGLHFARALSISSAELLSLRNGRTLETLLAEEPAEPNTSRSIRRKGSMDELILASELPFNLETTEQSSGDQTRDFRARFELTFNQLLVELSHHGESLPFAKPVFRLAEDLRKDLDSRTVLLILYLGNNFNGDRALFSLLLTSAETRLGEVAFPPELASVRDVVYRVRREIVRSPGRKWWLVGKHREVTRDGEALLHRLYEIMLSKWAGELEDFRRDGKDHLCIVPHGPFHYFPFHLLLEDGTALAERWRITYLPNLHLLGLRHRQPGGPLPRARGVSAVGIDFVSPRHPRYSPIPQARDEATCIAKMFGAEPILNEQATRDRIWLALRSSKCVHVASHGEIDVEAPSFQSIVLNTGDADARMRAIDILGLDLRELSLVTLSACETALGRFDIADNIRGLPANLLLAGAGALVGTLWPVETNASRHFFLRLYEGVRHGKTRLDAFIAAQEETRTVYPQFRDWGAFYYMGDWGEIPEARTFSVPGIPGLLLSKRPPVGANPPRSAG